MGCVYHSQCKTDSAGTVNLLIDLKLTVEEPGQSNLVFDLMKKTVRWYA